MDDNRILTNKIFKQKINELVGADVVELEAANDDLALNCKVFETGMDAIKTIIPEPGPTPTPTPTDNPIEYFELEKVGSLEYRLIDCTPEQLFEKIENGIYPIIKYSADGFENVFTLQQTNPNNHTSHFTAFSFGNWNSTSYIIMSYLTINDNNISLSHWHSEATM